MVTAIRHAIRDSVGELLGAGAEAHAGDGVRGARASAALRDDRDSGGLRGLLPGGETSPSVAAPPIDEVGTWCLRCGYSVRVKLPGRRCCGCCAGQTLARQGTVRLSGYGDERAWGAVVREVKFGKDRRGGRAAGQALGNQWMRLAALDEVPHPAHIACIVPVPMPWQRRIDRGIDHTWCIGQALAGWIGVPLLPLLSQRVGPPQRAQGRISRLQRRSAAARMIGRRDLAQALLARRAPLLMRGIPHGWSLKHARQRVQGGCRTVVVLDDVLTTGATVEECCLTLKSMLGIEFRLWAAVGCVTD
jgi:predicted amidophosphoribosyltransferase